MIDIYAPMELDDGRPVTMVPQDEWPEEDDVDGLVYINVEGPYLRDDPHHAGRDQWWYRTDDGSWDGDYVNECFKLRNVAAFEPVVEEDWS